MNEYPLWSLEITGVMGPDKLPTRGYGYEVVCAANEEGGYDARIPALRGCVAHGSTSEYALECLYEVMKAWLEIGAEAGWDIPEPTYPI